MDTESSPWPLLAGGITNGEGVVYMAKTRLQMTDAEKDEIARRARHLLKLHGIQDEDSPQLWRKYSVVYQAYPLMISSDEFQLNVMFAGPPDARGLQLFQTAFQLLKETGHIDTFPLQGKPALAHMRMLMLLDDLADV